jgi:CBS-domain-containing membrane protein
MLLLSFACIRTRKQNILYIYIYHLVLTASNACAKKKTDAAALMLKMKIHRIPILNDQQKVVGACYLN